MKNSNFTLAVIFGLVMLLFATCKKEGSEVNNPLLGKWLNVQDTDSITITFNADMSAPVNFNTSYRGVRHNDTTIYTYSFTSSTFTITSVGGHSYVDGYTISEDVLTIWPIDEPSVKTAYKKATSK